MIRRLLVLTGGLLFGVVVARGQRADVLSFVDPFIGTAKSDFYTKWGNEGGTYPGAVAPWGYMQLSPETRDGKGYDYADKSIAYFSCAHHMSGYPSGSAGSVRVMPYRAGAASTAGVASRPFEHRDEAASPGYYKVKFSDDGTVVEATADAERGVFRFTFPTGVQPAVSLSGMPVAFVAGAPYSMENGVLTFKAGTTMVELMVSVSPLGMEDARRRIDGGRVKGEYVNEAYVNGAKFDDVLKATQDAWRKCLSVVEVDDPSVVPKKIFYTALYHAMLLPWIEGPGGRYGAFSPWDTFRSLHPLLCLLFPDKQRDMIASLLSGDRIPTGPMTGNHGAPVIVDSWLKGIHVGDSGFVYTMLRKGIADVPYTHSDRSDYVTRGYVPLTRPESVTRTVEYAYDDWSLGQFAAKVMGRPADADTFGKRGYSYRNLFDDRSMFLLPRDDSGFKQRPGTSGYKEGDAWVYSYFAPQHPDDLINLMGGRAAFTQRLDAALTKGDIVFDNETVFHIPYLFNYADSPAKTQKWVRAFRDKRFAATPGGLPGNDDLGSMSSWYVFSALGFYPVCPGRPEYAIGTPLFKSVRLHLKGGKELVVRSVGEGGYVKSVRLNGTVLPTMEILHSAIVQGGELLFEMGKTALETKVLAKRPFFMLTDMGVSKEQVLPNEAFWVYYTLHCVGALGTAMVDVTADGKVVARQNTLVHDGADARDSVLCRLYGFGKVVLRMGGVAKKEVTVMRGGTATAEVSEMSVTPLIRKGERQTLRYVVQNVGGEKSLFAVPIKVNGKTLRTERIELGAGEKKALREDWKAAGSGMQRVEVMGASVVYKLVADDTSSLILDIHGDTDRSGFNNLVEVFDKYKEVDHSPVLDKMGESITMMAWVHPDGPGEPLMDVFSKGDHHVLQIAGNKELTFFAGGWGRGDCTVPLPADWLGHWHHIAGVCAGNELKVYIDGKLCGTAEAGGRVNLSVESKFVLGRNEEFPGERQFEGTINDAKVFAAPLSAEAIGVEMRKSKF